MSTIISAGLVVIAKKVDAGNKKMQEIHIQFNSRMEEFIELIKKASKAEGLLQGKEESKSAPKK